MFTFSLCIPQVWFMEPERDIQPESWKRNEHLSKDGKWRSFPKVPHLLQYVSNDNHNARIRINGKGIPTSRGGFAGCFAIAIGSYWPNICCDIGKEA